jgi:hypothetical protein
MLLTLLTSLMKQSLKRYEGWKEFYTEEMNSISPNNSDCNIYTALSLERKAAVHNNSGDYEKASELIHKIIDEHCQGDSEKGWYLQILA